MTTNRGAIKVSLEVWNWIEDEKDHQRRITGRKPTTDEILRQLLKAAAGLRGQRDRIAEELDAVPDLRRPLPPVTWGEDEALVHGLVGEIFSSGNESDIDAIRTVINVYAARARERKPRQQSAQSPTVPTLNNHDRTEGGEQSTELDSDTHPGTARQTG